MSVKKVEFTSILVSWEFNETQKSDNKSIMEIEIQIASLEKYIINLKNKRKIKK